MVDYALDKYRETTKRILRVTFPNLTERDIDRSLDYSINKRYKEEPCSLYNNYIDDTKNSTLLDMTNYILNREPIITAWGVIFKRHGTCPNPLAKMVEKFMDQRGIHKNEMFKHPKYSEEWEKYNLFQLLDKTDCNSIYGILGLFSSIFYNLHVAASITAQGKSCVSAMGLQFEMFLANNVKFGSLDEVVTFIDNVMGEASKRQYSDFSILDGPISVEECFNKIICTCGFQWIPDEEEVGFIWTLLHRLSQEDINRLYYKNNLYGFIENTSMTKALKLLLSTLNSPFMNPNKPPKEIKDELDEFTSLLMEYVYYGYHIVDRIDRMENMIRNVVLVLDTDSNIVSFDAWYRCVLDKIKGDDFTILHKTFDLVEMIKKDEYGDIPVKPLITFTPPKLDYDFYTDETIELERSIDLVTLIPQDGLRYSIINIIAYVMDAVIADYMVKYTQQSNSWQADKKCLMIAKNEYLFKTLLLTEAKKNYGSIQELQEGNYLGSVLDLKGLAIDKSSMNETTRKALKSILYEDILNIDTIDQIEILKKMSILQNQIYQSLQSGKKNYYKPVTIKSMNTYDDPMRIQGIKASVVWNYLREESQVIDLTERNAIDILKLNINCNNIDLIKGEFPTIYSKLLELVGLPKEPTANVRFRETFKGSISAIAIPKDTILPKWLIPFIDYTTIINDNLKNMPLESLGIRRGGKDSVNFTNILKL